jgi:Tfp pilus assembly protein PilO
MDPSTVAFIKGIVALVVAVAVPVAGYAAVVATRAIWVKGEPGKLDDAAAMREELDQLRGRVAELEAVPDRMAELEERLDFSERLLSQQRESERLPGGRP